MGFLLYTLVLITFLAILWKINSVARCVLKFTFFGITSMIFACAPIPLMLLKPRDSKNALIPAALLRATERIYGLSYNVEGIENIIKDSGCVVLINHQSAIDLFVLAYLWPLMPNSTVISKKEIFYIQPFGLASWLWGTIFINRVNAKDAQSTVNQTGEIIRRRKARVLMFPEGTRNLGNTLLPFKKGAFHLAIASKVPIQPVAVSRYSFLGKFRFDSGHITIRILPAVSTEGCTSDDIPKLIDKTYKMISENVNEISSKNNVKNNLKTS
ncbi:1-acyl-sn-glycerol-3-phosphate acyltransferase alpha-like [Diorhabda sublineata]|uniref:1-acyl-sn-glycerol-3-phosphate acyltransferase alpha-like n=1 Tax=Diorhabda sublineata TaxID=1163346 RepID=UPI0024E0A367|nr:1-acyl-sn-glycerol-3-phosphate acyltransferase alpha-like [Diorhabda sublineata]